MSEELEAREIAAEQDYVDEVYVQLEASTRNARALAAEGHSRGRLEHEGGLVERDAMVFQAAKRIAQLDAAHEGLVFGRLDLTHDKTFTLSEATEETMKGLESPVTIISMAARMPSIQAWKCMSGTPKRTAG